MSFISKYGFWGSVRLAKSLLYTKLFFPKAKIIRLPFDIRNKKNIEIGINFITGYGCRIEAHPVNESNKKILKIGDNVQINDYVHIACSESVHIGNDVLIASKVFITDLNHGNYSGSSTEHDHPESKPAERKLITKPVYIEDKVWIGESVSVLPGVTIGRGAVIGSLSLVNKDIPAYTIAAGVPARVIKKFNFDTNEWERVK
jgi:acetyltransferase-like isoleucine patch superfamily enzyme